MTAAILEKINYLPEHLQDDVENYIDFLIQKQSKNTFNDTISQINWTDSVLDSETDALVRDSIARRKAGDTSHLYEKTALKEIFYDL